MNYFKTIPQLIVEYYHQSDRCFLKEIESRTDESTMCDIYRADERLHVELKVLRFDDSLST